MRALTLKGPWGFAVTKLGKDTENRSWTPGTALAVGDWFAIHGGKRPTNRAALIEIKHIAQDLLLKHGLPKGATDVTLEDATPEGILAVARYGGLIAKHEDGSIWHDYGFWGWKLKDVRVLPVPVACRGAQGLWEVTADVLENIRAQLGGL